MRRLLLCPPDHYGIEYEINPWMSRARGADVEATKRQWHGLHEKLSSLDCQIDLVTPQPKLPDMVFTANAGLTVGKKFIPSNFRHVERSGEAPHFARWMKEHGYEVIWLPENLYFEGEGDALFVKDALFCGYKFRSDINSHRAVADILGCLVISVELVDPRFYHLDTCFSPLPDGGAAWFPAAFDEYGQRTIREHVGDLIDVVGRRSRAFFLQRRCAGKGHCSARRRAEIGEGFARSRIQLSSAADDGIPQSGRRMQMPDDVYAAA